MSKHITNYKPKDFAELLNVSVKTLQRWDRDKILVAKRTPTDRRYYTYDQYLEFKGVSNDSNTKKIEEDEEIAKSIQNGNKSNREPKTKD